MNPPPGTPRLIIGCGYLGLRVARLWQADGPVFALTRSRADELAGHGLIPVVGDVLDPASLRRLPAVSEVLYAVGFDRRAGRAMRDVYVDGLGHVLDALPGPARFVHVSSTGVYAQEDGSLVDEESPTEPVDEPGRVVLEAEHLLRARLPAAVILRFAGIYGPGRLLRAASLQAGEPVPGDPERWLNLIHVADGAAACVAAAARAPAGSRFNVADDEPVRRRDFFTVLGGVVGAPPVRFDPDAPSARGDRANRRVSNRRLRQELGVELAYPSCRLGLPAAVAGE